MGLVLATRITDHKSNLYLYKMPMYFYWWCESYQHYSKNNQDNKVAWLAHGTLALYEYPTFYCPSHPLAIIKPATIIYPHLEVSDDSNKRISRKYFTTNNFGLL